MLIGVGPTKEQIIDKGMDLMSQCIKFDAEIGEVTTVMSLNVLGIVYSVSVPTHEMTEPSNLEAAWKALIQDFGVFHMLGQSRRVQDGSREMTEGEIKALEESKSSR